MSSYSDARALFASYPAFTTPLPVGLLPYVALITLSAAFGLTFLFTTLRKSTVPINEMLVAGGASGLIGIGLVALFCTFGVHV